MPFYRHHFLTFNIQLFTPLVVDVPGDGRYFRMKVKGRCKGPFGIKLGIVIVLVHNFPQYCQYFMGEVSQEVFSQGAQTPYGVTIIK